MANHRGKVEEPIRKFSSEAGTVLPSKAGGKIEEGAETSKSEVIARAISPTVTFLDEVEEGRAQHMLRETNFFKHHPINTLIPGETFEVPVSLIVENPNNARKFFEDEKLSELADSLKNTQEQIPQAFYDDAKFVLIDGARRLRALKKHDPQSSMKICLAVKVKSSVELYFRSRSANVNEPLTIYDDAIGFINLLEQGQLKQADLIRLLNENGEKKYHQSGVSGLIALGRLPDWLLNQMRKYPHLHHERIATKLAALLSPKVKDGATSEDVFVLVDKIGGEETPLKELEHEFESWLAGKTSPTAPEKKQKPHAEATPVKYGKTAGVIKYFQSRKELKMNLTSISGEQHLKLKSAILAILQETPSED